MVPSQQKSHWLKVGIYISVVYFCIGFPFQIWYLYENTHAVDNSDLLAGLLSAFINFPILITFRHIIPTDLGILSNILTIPGYFIIGIFIGWVYGRIKDRNKI